MILPPVKRSSMGTACGWRGCGGRGNVLDLSYSDVL